MVISPLEMRREATFYPSFLPAASGVFTQHQGTGALVLGEHLGFTGRTAYRRRYPEYAVCQPIYAAQRWTTDFCGAGVFGKRPTKMADPGPGDAGDSAWASGENSA